MTGKNHTTGNQHTAKVIPRQRPGKTVDDLTTRANGNITVAKTADKVTAAPRGDYVPRPYQAAYVNLKRVEAIKEKGFSFVDLKGRNPADLRENLENNPIEFYRVQNAEGTLLTIAEVEEMVKAIPSKFAGKPKDGKPLPKAGAKPTKTFKDPRGEVKHTRPDVNPRYKKEPDPLSPFYQLKGLTVKK